MSRLSESPILIQIGWALVLSLAAHLLLWFGPQIHISFRPLQPEPLQARLINLPQKPVKIATSKPKPHPKRAASRQRAAPAPLPADAEMRAANQSVESPPPPQPDAAPPEKLSAEKTATAADDTQQNGQGQEKPEQPFPLPERAEIQFNLYKGGNGLKVGEVVHTWQIRGDHYSLTSITEATGIFSLIKSGRLVQTSQGRLTKNGLEPDAFWIERGQSADSTESALFDRKSKMLTFGSPQNSRTVPLPGNTQDLLSFVYQIAIDPPQSGTVHLFITNGRKLDTYDYTVMGEETLNIPLGQVRALHLSKVHGQNEDGTDIWLDADQHYLPVKIRLTDRSGDIAAEQSASAIHIK